MRVDNPEQGPHDHAFGHGASQPELHEIGLGTEAIAHDVAHDAAVHHGVFDEIGHTAAPGGHVEIGQLEHDFNTDHGLHGLDGLHDSVHHSIGLGFEGDQHHTLNESLHHDGPHDPAHDTHHDLGDLFHHG